MYFVFLDSCFRFSSENLVEDCNRWWKSKKSFLWIKEINCWKKLIVGLFWIWIFGNNSVTPLHLFFYCFLWSVYFLLFKGLEVLYSITYGFVRQPQTVSGVMKGLSYFVLWNYFSFIWFYYELIQVSLFYIFRYKKAIVCFWNVILSEQKFFIPSTVPIQQNAIEMSW